MELSKFKEIFYNAQSSEPRTWERIAPVRFAIPVIIYRVKVLEHTNVGNIFSETIVNLSKLGKSNDEIADIMCIDKRIIESALEEMASFQTEDGKSEPPVHDKDQYIVYDCYNGRFFESYVNADAISEYLKTEEIDINYGIGKLNFVKNFADSDRRTAYILNSNKKLYEPEEKEIREHIEARKRNVYDRKTFYQYVNMYETHYAFLVATYFVPDEASDQRFVLDPIYERSLSNNLKDFFLEILEKEAKCNTELKKNLDRMEEEVRIALEAKLAEQDNNNLYSRIVAEKFRDTVDGNKKYGAIERQLVALEIAYAPFTEPEYVGKDLERKRSYSKELAIAIRDVIEHTLAATVRAHADTGRCKSAENFDHRSYIHLVNRVGFDVDDDTKNFIKYARPDSVKGILSKPLAEGIKSRHRSSLFMACVLLTMDNNDGVMSKLASRFPDMPARIEKLIKEFDMAKHDDDDARIYTVDDARARYAFIAETVHILLRINADIITDKPDLPIQANADSVPLVKEMLEKYDISNQKIKGKAFGMLKVFFEKSGDFWGACYNCTEQIIYESIYPYLTQELLDDIIGNMPSEDDQMTVLNGILEKRKIADRIKTHSNRERAQNIDELYKLGMSGLIYIFIILADKHHPQLLEKLQGDLEGIFDLAEFVKAKRGHNNTTDFSGPITEFNETIGKILNYSTKIMENEDGQE